MILLGLSACGGGGSGDGATRPSNSQRLSRVFVIAMENHDAADIYGNTTDAPYINGELIPNFAISTSFVDELPDSPSEPHYVLMEAGTNTFADDTFTNDDPPSASNSTADDQHLAAQIEAAGDGLDWRSYQEGIDSTSGACPIASSGFYHPKHDPFVFFQDVAGSPPSQTDAHCAAHHSPLSALAGDLAAGRAVSYNFITPDQCHDMHGQTGCPNLNTIRAGDDWLAANLPALIAAVGDGSGVILIVWDEGSSSTRLPFLAVGPTVKKGYASGVTATHSSLVKTIEEILGLPILSRVAAANDLADMFEGGLS